MPPDNPLPTPADRPSDTSRERRGAIQERHEWHRRHLRYNEPFDAVEDLLAMLVETEADRDRWETLARELSRAAQNFGAREERRLHEGEELRLRAERAEAREAALRAALQTAHAWCRCGGRGQYWDRYFDGADYDERWVVCEKCRTVRAALAAGTEATKGETKP